MENTDKKQPASAWKKVWNVLALIPIIVVVIAALFSLSSLLKLPGGYRMYAVVSGSMEPKIHTGSLVIDKEESSYAVNDVITFKVANSKSTVTHRIKEIISQQGQTFYKVKGDANNAEDPDPVFEKNVVGKVVFIIPFLGYLTAFVKTLPGLLLLIIVPATIIIYSELITIKNETVKLLAERKLRKLTPLETVEEKIGEEVIAVEEEVDKVFKPKDKKK